MTARKASASKTISSARSKIPRARSRAPKARPDARPGTLIRDLDLAKYATPVSAALAAAALAAAAYFFKDEVGAVLGDTMQYATKRGAKLASATSRAMDGARGQVQEAAHTIADKISIDPLLAYAGLARRSTLHTVAGPAIGVACGFVAGSVLTHLFGSAVLAKVKEVVAEATQPATATGAEPQHDPAAPAAEPPRPNGVHGDLS